MMSGTQLGFVPQNHHDLEVGPFAYDDRQTCRLLERCSRASPKETEGKPSPNMKWRKYIGGPKRGND
jgi:hypothetical protein